MNEEKSIQELELELNRLKVENELLRGLLIKNEVISDDLRTGLSISETEQVPFRIMVANVRDYAIFMLDPNGYIVSWNEGAQRIKQYKEAEIIGKHFSVFYTEEDLAIDKPPNELKIALETGKYEEEGWRVKKDGSIFWANVLITALFDAGKHIGFAKITRDLTERKKSEELMLSKNKELSASNSELEQFAYVASHDLQEPLRIVASYVQLLSNKYAKELSDEAKEYIGFAYDGAQRMRQLINDLLEYSRVGRMFKPLENVDINAIFNVIKQDFELTNENVSISKIGNLPMVKAEKVYMQQLFLNLIGNAVKFHKPNQPTTVVVSAERNGNKWQFNVADNGIGIEQKFVERIFAIFQRLHTRDQYPGSGIGLSICKKIIEFHGGDIWIESKDGDGSTFHFTLPSTF